jgi:hypothetical protein
MLVLNNNFLNSTTIITATSSYSSYPLSNLLDYQLYNYAKVGSGNASLSFALAAPQSVNTVAIGGHNCTSASLIISNDPTFTSNSVTIALDCTQQNIFATFPSLTAQYFQLVLNDNYVKQIGYVSIGKNNGMSDMAAGSTDFTYLINDPQSESISFQSYGSTAFTQRHVNVNFPLCTKSDRDQILSVFQTNRNWLPFFCKLWDDTVDFPTLYCTVGTNSLNVKRSGSYTKPYSIDFILKEAL